MMTTHRTAIRSRLAVRRATHRPPSGRRKAGHRSIVAPLAATLAASLALAGAVALAKVDRERRNKRQRRLDRKLGLISGEHLADGLKRMALGQIDVATEQLTRAGEGEPNEKAVHETRKALKRLRALIRLLEHELGERAYARESTALRELAQRLAAARDSQVMLESLDTLIARHPRRLARKDIKKLRKRLLAAHAQTQRLTLGDPAARVEVLSELRAMRVRVAAWNLRERDDLQLIEADLQRLYRQGRKRYRRLARGKAGGMRAMHEWRKRVKDLRYAAEMLQHRDEQAKATARARGKRAKKRRRAQAQARRDIQRLQLLARRADELGERLGEEHDLAVLAEHIRAGRRKHGDQTWRLRRRTRKTLQSLISRRRRKLRRDAMRDGERLYRAKPAKFMRRVRKAHARGARPLS
jgi:hypothetical protein